ncbi:MAG: AAA family ATPase [Aquificaceae bacterium]
MLVRLTLEDFFLIKGQEVEFGKGLNVITGETGTGKSLTLSSLLFLMGQEGEYPEGTSVEAELIVGEEQMILRREVLRGRSRYYLNGRGSTRKVAEELLSAHLLLQGQNDKRKIVRADFQREVYDRFADTLELRREVERVYQEMVELAEKIREIKDKGLERELKKRLLQEEIREVEEIGLTPEDYLGLKRRLEEINLGERINRLVQESLSGLENAYEGLMKTIRALRELAYYRDVKEDLERLELFVESLLEIKRHTERLSLYYSQEELDLLNEKLYRVQRLERKRLMGYPDLWERTQKLKEELRELEEEEDLEGLERRLEGLEGKFQELCEELSRKRLGARESFERKVLEYLRSMGLERASFRVDFEEKVGRYGREQVRFLFSSYGREEGDLSQVASGGEVSRLSLALFMLLPPAQTYVLDEVDTGISGITSLKLARLLKELSLNTQLITITHSPAIASAGDKHFTTRREYLGDSPFIKLEELKGEERLKEIARLMGRVSEKTLEGARELIREVCGV